MFCFFFLFYTFLFLLLFFFFPGIETHVVSMVAVLLLMGKRGKGIERMKRRGRTDQRNKLTMEDRRSKGGDEEQAE